MVVSWWKEKYSWCLRWVRLKYSNNGRIFRGLVRCTYTRGKGKCIHRSLETWETYVRTIVTLSSRNVWEDLPMLLLKFKILLRLRYILLCIDLFESFEVTTYHNIQYSEQQWVRGKGARFACGRVGNGYRTTRIEYISERVRVSPVLRTLIKWKCERAREKTREQFDRSEFPASPTACFFLEPHTAASKSAPISSGESVNVTRPITLDIFHRSSVNYNLDLVFFKGLKRVWNLKKSIFFIIFYNSTRQEYFPRVSNQ